MRRVTKAFKYGMLQTDRGYIQIYKTVYINWGLGASATFNYTTIISKKGYKPTFSDWEGSATGISRSYLVASGSVTWTDKYVAPSFGVGLGDNFSNYWGTAGAAVSYTTLLGKPMLGSNDQTL